MSDTCVFWERVSASLDGELPASERELIAAHQRRCAHCRTRTEALHALSLGQQKPAPPPQMTAVELRWFGGRRGRALLALVGVAIATAGLPAMLNSDTADSAAHLARHLATWQIGFGIGLIVAARTTRLTHAMLALGATIALLTMAASFVDIVFGHQGPMAEGVHLIELIGVVLLWAIVPPQLRPTVFPRRLRRRRSHPPIHQRTP